MNRQEWDVYLSGMDKPTVIRGDEFPPPLEGEPMRLLCRGYHANGGPNVRVWLDLDGRLGLQHNDGDINFKEEWEVADLYPTKRAYREETDLLFAELIRERYAYPLSFTTWRD